MPPFVEPLDVVVASQKAVAGLQSAAQQGQEVVGEVAPPVVDLTHYNVSAPWGEKTRVRCVTFRQINQR